MVTALINCATGSPLDELCLLHALFPFREGLPCSTPCSGHCMTTGTGKGSGAQLAQMHLPADTRHEQGPCAAPTTQGWVLSLCLLQPAVQCVQQVPLCLSLLLPWPQHPRLMFLVNAPDKVRALQQCSRVSLLPSPAPASATFVSSLCSASPGWNQRGNSSFISSSPKLSSCCKRQSGQKGTPGKHSPGQGRSCTPGAGLQLADSSWVLTDPQRGGTRRASVIANCRCAGPGKTLTG